MPRQDDVGHQRGGVRVETADEDDSRRAGDELDTTGPIAGSRAGKMCLERSGRGDPVVEILDTTT